MGAEQIYAQNTLLGGVEEACGTQQHMTQPVPHSYMSDRQFMGLAGEYVNTESNVTSFRHRNDYSQQQPWCTLQRPRSWQYNPGTMQNQFYGSLEAHYSPHDAPYPTYGMYGPPLSNTTKQQLLSCSTPQYYTPINELDKYYRLVENPQFQQAQSMLACQSPERAVAKPRRITETKSRKETLYTC